MGERSRVKFIVLIALILGAAIVYSFSVSQFQQTPEVSLGDPEQNQSTGPGHQDLPDGTVVIEVAPDTVQNVIRTLNRYTSYRRRVRAAYLEGGEEIGTLTATVAVDGGWTRCDVSEEGGWTEHSIVNEDSRWLWYDNSREYVRLAARESTADLAQRVPTYEDVLEAERRDITAASYVERGGIPCVYVEVHQRELGYLERYWISVESGLLVASETEKDGETVYRMDSYEVESPLPEVKDSFTLPDGTVLHQGAA